MLATGQGRRPRHRVWWRLLPVLLLAGCVSAPSVIPAEQLPPVYPPPAPAAAPNSAEKSNADTANTPARGSLLDLSGLAPEKLYKSAKTAVGLGPNEQIAREAFREGEALFREKKYDEAAAKFKLAANRWPDSLLEEDALFLLGECYFFADRYPSAHDTYANLLKKYSNTRYLDTVMRREFAIGRYWERMQAHKKQWALTPNFTDKTLPWFDPFGNGINAFQMVQLYDPLGPLGDDAVMAMGNANFTRGRYEDAAQHYDTLRKEYPNSEFQVPAHLLGLQAKLRTYQGGLYDGAPLEEADQIARQALTQFGRELGPEKDRLLDATKEISEKKAERDWAMGQFYERKGCYGAARYYYIDLIKNYPLTRHAEIARKRLAEIRDRPDVPPNRFKWLTNLFPSDE